MLKSNYLFLDLEMNKPSGKIIQIGYCIVDIYKDKLLLEKSLIVNPNELIDPYITNLTGINQSQVDIGVSLLDAYNELAKDHKTFDCFINPITWGGGDSQEIKNQLGEHANPWCFGRRWIDVKTLWHVRQITRQGKLQGGLARCMTKVGLKFEGRKHNAMDDAYNTYRIFQVLRKDLLVQAASAGDNPTSKR